MHPHSLNRVIASLHLSDDGVVIVRIKPSPVADLASGFGVKRCVIKNDLAFVASLQLLCALPATDDGQHLAAVRASLPVAFEGRCAQFLIGRIRRLLGRALPGCARKRPLLVECVGVPLLVQPHSSISHGVFYEIESKAKSVGKLESVASRQDWSSSLFF